MKSMYLFPNPKEQLEEQLEEKDQEEIPLTKKRRTDLALPDLPEDVIADTLMLLPVRSICRFRAVSRRWGNLLTNPEFRKIPSFQLEVQHNSDLRYVLDLGSGGKVVHFYLVPCKGIPVEAGYLVSYRSIKDLICYRCDSRNLYLLDKITNEYYILPANPLSADFDYELGFDSASREYKVLLWPTSVSAESQFYITCIKISNNTPRGLTFGSSGGGSPWRKPFGEEPFLDREIEKSFVTTAGIMYMFDGTKFISFNLQTEKFNQIMLPIRKWDDDYESLHPEFPRKDISYESYDDDDDDDNDVFYESTYSYELFDYMGKLGLVELETVNSVHRLEGSSIEAVWVLHEVENNKWIRMLKNNTPLPISGLDGSDIWCRKHSRVSSTRSGDHLLITAVLHDRLFVLLYSFFNCGFSYMATGSQSHSQDASCVECEFF